MKKLLTLALLVFSFCAVAQITGIKVGTPIIKNFPTDNTITGYADQQAGGYHIVPNYHGRDSLNTFYNSVMKVGMLCYEQNVDSTYRWTGLVWMPVIGGGGSSTWGSITGTLSAQTDLNTALNGKLPKTFSANQTITLSGDTLKFGTHGTFISDSTMAAVGNQGFASMLPASFRLGKNLTTWLSITGGSSANTITGNQITITPKVSFAVNPALGVTSTVGYVPTATNTSGDWSWTAPASNSLLKANNLSDVNSVDTSRKNLGFQTIWNRKGTVMYGSTALEEGNVGEPTVIYEGNPQILTADTMVFKMWYGGGFTTPYIFYAESVDGVSWTKYPTAVVSSHNRTFVFKNGSTYYLYAANAANTQLDQYTSSDGVTWTLAHSGVVTSSSLFTSYVFSPFVFVESGTWKMLLDCGIGAVNPGVVEYYLTSTDGVTWVQGATNPVIPTYTVGNPYILKDGGTYWCYGHGIGTVGGSTANTDIYRQSSTDMIHWTAAKLVFPRRSVDEGPSNPLGQVADLSILPVGNSVYLWYVATPDGTTPTGRAHIKLAVANMPLSKLVTTNEGDGSDINPATPAFTYDPSNQNLIITSGGSGSSPALTLNGFTTPYMQFETNSSPSAILGNGISTHLTGSTDFSVIANGSGNISIEAGNLYLNTWGNTTYLPKMAYLGLNSSTSYGYYNYSGGNFFHQYTYNTSHNLYLGNAASVFSAPQNINDVIYASADNQNFSTIAANNQVDAFAQFNKTSKSLILNGGNSAGFTDDANLILNLQSTTKGASFSPMTTTQRTAIASPTESELVYDLTLHNYYFHNGTAWTAMGGGGGGGGTTTNLLTVNSSGAGDASPFTFDGSAAKTISYNSIGAQVAGTYLTPTSTNTVTNKDLTSGSNTFPTFNQNTTGTAVNITASSNSTLTTLSALSLPYSQLTGTPSLSGYVPYSGATTDLVLGANNLSAQSATITGTAGAGFIDMVAQSSPPSTPSANHQHIYADASGRFTIMGSNGFAAAFTKSGLTASRIYTLPDSTGIIALENRIIPNANLANSAVTVNGTSIALGASGTVTAAAGTLTGSTLNSSVTASSLTSFGAGIALGTPGSGVMTNVTGLPLTTGVTGILPIANGGTNLSSYTAGDLPYASAANVLSKLAIGATGNPLIVIAGLPAYSNLVLTNPASVATFTLAAGKTFTNNNTFTLNSTDGITGTTPTTSFTFARTDAAQTFTGTQTFGTIAATLVQGTIQSNSGGLNTSNIYASAVTGFSAQSGATLIFGTATTTQGRVILGNGSTALSLTGGNSYANVDIGQGATVTVPTGTTSTWITQLAITPLPTITKSGSAVVTNTATAFFGAASTSGTNNYTAYFDTGNLQIANGNLTFASIGNGIAIKEGTNAAMGVGTLSGGTLVISNTRVTANSRIFLTDQGGTVTNLGSLYISARSAGTSFTVSSSNVLDVSTFAWVILEPAP